MNRFVLSIILSLTMGAVSAQKVYFVYLQSDPVQPFFVKMNGNLYSSTGSGYLILSKLHDSTYSFTVGFPQNAFPEQQFSVPVKAKDHGYLLKNFGEKGWGLFDLQTMGITYTESAQPVKKEVVAQKETKSSDSFTDILSKAADDPTLKEKPVVKKEEPKVEVKTEPKTVPMTMIEPANAVIQTPPQQTETVKGPEQKKDEPKVTTPVVQTEIVKKEELKPVARDTVSDHSLNELVDAGKTNEKKIAEVSAPVKEELVKPSVDEPYKASVVTKRSESSTTEGFGLVYIDTYADGKKDTIRILIPNPKPLVVPSANVKKEEKKFLDITTDTLNTKEKTIVAVQDQKPVVTEQEVKPLTDTVSKVTAPVVPSKTNCTAVADESDFYRVRKKMAAAESDDDMIAEARKGFKQKCYTVQQIRNLGTLFLSDKGKYAFYDEAFGHTSEPANFASLESDLKDPYYIKRFKAMLGN